jgi:ribosomal protein S18 acetylase RimI-like enzyme
MYTYRDAKQQDFERIASFPDNRRDLFYMFPKGVFPVQAETLHEVAQSRTLPTVLEDDGIVIGYSNFYDLEEGTFAWLGNVIIAPDYRGKGAGKALIQFMLNRAAIDLQLRELRLICHNPNTKALFLYHSLGFVPYDIRSVSDLDDQAVAGILMRRELR